MVAWTPAAASSLSRPSNPRPSVSDALTGHPVAPGRWDVEAAAPVGAHRDRATPVHVVLARTLARSTVILPISGTARREYLAQPVAAASLELRQENVERLD